MGHGRDLVVVGEGGIERGGGFHQLRDHQPLFLAAHPPALHREMRGQRRQHRQLAGESLGAGDANLRPGMGRQQQIGLARHAGGGHIDHHGNGLPIGLAVAQRGQRIGGFAALADEDGEAARLQHRIAIAELGGDIDIHRQAGEGLEPVFRHEAGVIGGAASHDGDALDRREVEIDLRQGHAVVHPADIAAQRLGDHGGLLEDFLLHEVAEIALLHRCGRGPRGGDGALHRVVMLVEDLRALAGDDHPVALFEIADLLGERRQRQRVRAEIGLAIAIAHHQRRAEPRADQHIGLRAEHDGQRKSPAQLRQRSLHRIGWRETRLDLLRDEMRHHLAVGLAFKLAAARGQIVAQLAEVLDDAVVHQRQLGGGMGVSVAGGGRAMRGPAGVRDADMARRGVRGQLGHQIVELARRAAADQLTILHGAHARRIIAAIFHAPQPIDQPIRYLFLADDADNAAHTLETPD